MTSIVANHRRPRVVIIGAGFGGLSAARRLAQGPFDVVVVDRHNYHLFQPLLYQVATAGLSPADIASPIRGILHGQTNASVILAKVSGVDVAGKEIVAEGRRIPFDYLVVATGAEHAYFGNDWASYAPGLKTIDDATYLRRRILLAFERAETESDPDERSRLLNFVVVGGGPTGVEMAGAIAELAKRALASDFRSIDPRCARVVLIEAGPRLLAPFDPSLSEAARRSLEQLGVEVRLGTGVTDCDCSGVSLGQERLQTRTIIWAAGVKASPVAEWLAVARDRAGRVKVQADLSAPGHPNIFVIGDVACAIGADGKPLPGVAPVAKQQGEYVANLLIARANGKTLQPFRYRDSAPWRRLAASGPSHSLAHSSFQDSPHGCFGASCTSTFLIGFRNRLTVAMNWGWNYMTFERGTRLITGISGSRIEDVVPVVTAAPPMAVGLEFLDNDQVSRVPASAKLGPESCWATPDMVTIDMVALVWRPSGKAGGKALSCGNSMSFAAPPPIRRSARMNANVSGEDFDEAFKRARDMDASLDEQLRAFADAARQRRPDFAAAVDRLVERLRRHGAGDAAPQSGEPIPPFVLPDDDGHMVSLDQLLDHGPVAVTFHRGHWCPYCRININALAQAHKVIAAEGGQIVAIMPDRQKFVAELQVAVECAVPDPHRHGQWLRAVVESHDLGGRGNAEDDGRPPGPSDFSGQQFLDASDPGDVRGRTRRDHQGAVHGPGLSQAYGDRGRADGTSELSFSPNSRNATSRPRAAS